MFHTQQSKSTLTFAMTKIYAVAMSLAVLSQSACKAPASNLSETDAAEVRAPFIKYLTQQEQQQILAQVAELRKLIPFGRYIGKTDDQKNCQVDVIGERDRYSLFLAAAGVRHELMYRWDIAGFDRTFVAGIARPYPFATFKIDNEAGRFDSCYTMPGYFDLSLRASFMHTVTICAERKDSSGGAANKKFRVAIKEAKGPTTLFAREHSCTFELIDVDNRED